MGVSLVRGLLLDPANWVYDPGIVGRRKNVVFGVVFFIVLFLTSLLFVCSLCVARKSV